MHWRDSSSRGPGSYQRDPWCHRAAAKRVIYQNGKVIDRMTESPLLAQSGRSHAPINVRFGVRADISQSLNKQKKRVGRATVEGASYGDGLILFQLVLDEIDARLHTRLIDAWRTGQADSTNNIVADLNGYSARDRDYAR